MSSDSRKASTRNKAKTTGRICGLFIFSSSIVGLTGAVKVPALPYDRATEQVEAQVSSPRVSKGWPQHN